MSAVADTLADCAAAENPGCVDKQKHVQDDHVPVRRHAAHGIATGHVQPTH